MQYRLAFFPVLPHSPSNTSWDRFPNKITCSQISVPGSAFGANPAPDFRTRTFFTFELALENYGTSHCSLLLLFCCCNNSERDSLYPFSRFTTFSHLPHLLFHSFSFLSVCSLPLHAPSFSPYLQTCTYTYYYIYILLFLEPFKSKLETCAFLPLTIQCMFLKNKNILLGTA